MDTFIPVMRVALRCTEGYWARDAYCEEDSFTGMVSITLMPPFDVPGARVVPFNVPMILTYAPAPSYVRIPGPPLASSSDSMLSDSDIESLVQMWDVESPTSVLPPSPRMVMPMSVLPPFDPATQSGFLFPTGATATDREDEDDDEETEEDPSEDSS